MFPLLFLLVDLYTEGLRNEAKHYRFGFFHFLINYWFVFSKYRKKNKTMYIHSEVDTELLNWKTTTTRKPLLMRGARQVGKSSAIRHLGQRFSYFIEINFNENRQL